MQKLRSITAVLDESSNPAAVLDKAEALARRFEARVELLRVFPRSGRRLESPVLRHVRERNTDLVIKARAGTHPVRRATLAENDWSLSQQCPVPLMLVTAAAPEPEPRGGDWSNAADRSSLGLVNFHALAFAGGATSRRDS